MCRVYILKRVEHHDYYGDEVTIIVAHTDCEWVKNYARSNGCRSGGKTDYEIVEFVDGHETMNWFSWE